jgi:hypothetical protein
MEESFKKESKISEKCFTRDRKLSFTDTMVFILRNAYKTLSVEIEQFFQQISDAESPPSKQALSKARLKIKHTGFRRINDTILEEYYSEPYKTYKGYRLLAADGSIIQLPSGQKITKAFGKMNKLESRFNCGHSITIYDVLNNIIIDSKLNKYGRSERAYLSEQLVAMQHEGKQKRDIIIADRGLPSLALFARMKQANYDYVFRYNGHQFLREVLEFARGSKTDMIVEVSLKGRGMRQEGGELSEMLLAGYEETMKLRVVKVFLQTGETEYLITSILDKRILSRQDVQKIYALRWGIEEGFKTLKSTMELENFSGKTEETILQEYHSKIAIYNLHAALVEEAQKELNKKAGVGKKERKYNQYRINQNVSYGLVRERLLDLFNQDDGNWEETYDYLLVAVQKNPIPVKPGRHYDRVNKYHLKFPSNRRRSI